MGKQSKVILSIIAIIVAGSLGYVSWSSRSTSNEQNITNQPLIQPEQQKNQELDSQGVEVITSNIDTSDWKIYRNEELEFEVKIPREGEVIENKSVRLFSEVGPIGDRIGIKLSDNKYGDPYWINIYRINVNSNISDPLEYFKAVHRGDLVLIKRVQTYYIGPDKFKFLEVQDGGFFKAYITITNNKYFEIDVWDSGLESLNKKAENIVSTFRFIQN